MSRHTEQKSEVQDRGPLAGLLFLIGGVGGLFAFISAVDPLL